MITIYGYLNMKINKINRFSHTGKSMKEKEAYKQFLSASFNLDKTEDDPININKTDESSFDEEEIPKIPKIQRKSNLLKVRDFMKESWVITIIGGLIVAVIVSSVGSFNKLHITQNVHDEKISNLEKNVKNINKENGLNQSEFNTLKQNFEIFKVELSKDLEFIKKIFKINL